MKKVSYTEGPWEVGDLDRNGQRIVRSRDIEICTCWHHSVGSIEKEMEQNAKLIATAPEMAEVLLQMYSHVSHGGPTRKDVEVLLKKAGIIHA
jgi:hypothetical protein